jgi:hypothetical protein
MFTVIYDIRERIWAIRRLVMSLKKVQFHAHDIEYSDYLCYLPELQKQKNIFVFHLTTDSDTFLTLSLSQYRQLQDVRVSGRRIKTDYYQCKFILSNRKFDIGGIVIAKKELQYGNEISMIFRVPVIGKLQILKLTSNIIEFHELIMGELEKTSPVVDRIFQRLYPEPDEIWDDESY